MKLYQEGSMYADIKARGDAPMFWAYMVVMFAPFAYIAIAALIGG